MSVLDQLDEPTETEFTRIVLNIERAALRQERNQLPPSPSPSLSPEKQD